MLKKSEFKKICTNVSTFSYIIGVYYKGNRKFIPVPETENINILKTKTEYWKVASKSKTIDYEETYLLFKNK